MYESDVVHESLTAVVINCDSRFDDSVTTTRICNLDYDRSKLPDLPTSWTADDAVESVRPGSAGVTNRRSFLIREDYSDVPSKTRILNDSEILDKSDFLWTDRLWQALNTGRVSRRPSDPNKSERSRTWDEEHFRRARLRKSDREDVQSETWGTILGLDEEFSRPRRNPAASWRSQASWGTRNRRHSSARCSWSSLVRRSSNGSAMIISSVSSSSHERGHYQATRRVDGNLLLFVWRGVNTSLRVGRILSWSDEFDEISLLGFWSCHLGIAPPKFGEERRSVLSVALRHDSYVEDFSLLVDSERQAVSGTKNFCRCLSQSCAPDTESKNVIWSIAYHVVHMLDDNLSSSLQSPSCNIVLGWIRIL